MIHEMRGKKNNVNVNEECAMTVAVVESLLAAYCPPQ